MCFFFFLSAWMGDGGGGGVGEAGDSFLWIDEGNLWGEGR